MTLHLKCPTYSDNVGDVIAEPIARHFLSNDLIVIRRGKDKDRELLDYPHENLMLVGSTIEWTGKLSHLCGVGFFSDKGKLHRKPKHVHAVRGPLTRALLEQQDVSTPEIYGDPGILLPYVIPAPNTPPVHKYGMIPHYIDVQMPIVDDWEKKGAHIIDVMLPPAEFVRELCSCEIIFSSSLHGIVLAHAYGRPALWIKISDNVGGEGFKFRDYYQSLGVAEENIRCVTLDTEMDPIKLSSSAQLHPAKPLEAGLLEAFEKVREMLHLSLPNRIDDAKK